MSAEQVEEYMATFRECCQAVIDALDRMIEAESETVDDEQPVAV